MNIEGSIYLVLAVVAAAQIGLPVYAAVRAFGAGNAGWGIGCLLATIVPFGFVLSVAYLIGPDRATRQLA